MNYIGLDSFEGLLHDSNFWKKGMFDNTSTNIVLNKIKQYVSNASVHQFKLIKGWFNDKNVHDGLLEATKDIILIHFDEDLGSSTTEALNMITPYLKDRKKPIYFLFDDWGLQPDEVPDALFKLGRYKPTFIEV